VIREKQDFMIELASTGSKRGSDFVSLCQNQLEMKTIRLN
jgi:hypothetical protein